MLDRGSVSDSEPDFLPEQVGIDVFAAWRRSAQVAQLEIGTVGAGPHRTLSMTSLTLTERVPVDSTVMVR
jgi:hypothetical protein